MKPGTIVTNGHLKMAVVAYHKGYVWCEAPDGEMLTFKLGTIRRV